MANDTTEVLPNLPGYPDISILVADPLKSVVDAYDAGIAAGRAEGRQQMMAALVAFIEAANDVIEQHKPTGSQSSQR